MLYITIRGERYKVNEKGEMTQLKNADFSGQWIFKGVSFHHWKQSIDIPFSEIWENPEKAIGGILWDIDYGTTRIWGGRYCGKLPRIEQANKA